MPFRKIYSSNRGTILVAIVVMIVISAIAFSTALYVLGDAIRAKREAKTMERLRAVEAALIGHQHAFLNESSSNYGYFSRQNTPPMAAITTTIGNLTDLQSHLAGLPATADAYGNNILLSSGATYSIYSAGPNGVDESGAGDDLSIDFTSVNRRAVDISVLIVDATESGSTALQYAGLNAPMMNNSYIYDADGDNTVDGPYDGRVIFGPTHDGTLANSDITVTLHSAPAFNGGAGTAPNRYNRSTASFEWDDVPIGLHLLKIQGNPDNVSFDPQWWDSGGTNTANMIYTPILINPTTTAITRQFNVVYPVIAASEAIQETGFGECVDETVTNDGDEIWDAMNDLSDGGAMTASGAQEFLSAGFGCPDYYEYDGFIPSWNDRRMRSLVRFDLTDFSNLSATSKVSYARLVLTTHISAVPAGTQSWSSSPNGSGTIEIYRFRNAWAEVSQADPYTPVTDPAPFGWANVDTFNTDYSDLQASFAYTSANFEGVYRLNVVEAVQQWVDSMDGGGWANNGFLILNTNDTTVGNWWCFKSSEATDNTDTRPRLIVSYYR
jgi:type II secretory pathway pseudopilin PulG